MATIDAKLRIAADVAQALQALKRLQREYKETGDAADQAAGGTDPAQAAAEARAAARAKLQAERAAAAEARRIRREEEAEKKAAAAAERKRLREDAQEAQRLRKAQNLDTFKQVQLAQQITDITSGLATGQAPLTVLLQQGGQLRDIFGGFGNALKAVGALLTPVRLAIGGVAAVVGVLAVNAVRGALEQDALNKSLALTGNIAGVTAGQLDQDARKIAESQKAAIGSVRETQAALVASGAFTGTTLESAGRAVTALQKLSGQSSEEIVKDFSGMADGVAAWAAKANKAYNFLSAEQFRYIRSLEAQGKTQEAMRVTMDALSGTMTSRAAPAIGTIEKLWKAAGAAVSWFVEQMKAVGRDETPEAAIERLRKKMEELRKARETDRGGRRKSTYDAQIADTQAELDSRERDLAQFQRNEQERAQRERDAQSKISDIQSGAADARLQAQAAEAAKSLATELARLQGLQDALERSHALGLVTEQGYNESLNQLEQERLRAQLAAAEEAEKRERNRSPGTPAEVQARRAAIAQAEAQVIDLKARLETAVSQGITLVGVGVLNDAKERSAAWADVWKQAADLVRSLTADNALTAGRRSSDPATRAAAEARARTAELQRQIDNQKMELRVQLALNKDPGQRAELQRQLDELTKQGDLRVKNAGTEGRFDALNQLAAEALDRVSNAQAAIERRVEAGVITTLQGEAEKATARDAEMEQLRTILRLLGEIEGLSPAEQNQVDQLKGRVSELANTATAASRTMRTTVKDGFATTLTDIATGAKTAGEAMQDFAAGVLRSMLNLISQNLGEQLANSLFGGLNGGGGGGLLSSVGNFMSTFLSAGNGAGRAAISAAGNVSLAAPAALARASSAVSEAAMSAAGARSGGLQINVPVTVEGGGAGMDATRAQALGGAVRGVVEQEITRQMRPGGLLAGR